MKQSLAEFLNIGVTPFHVMENAKTILEEKGFFELKEEEAWSLVPGGAYYVVRSSSSMVAFRVPMSRACAFQMAMAHSDSPCLKIKNVVADTDYLRLRVEKYGGLQALSWFDRPLGIAGRVFVSQNGKITEKTVHLDKQAVIPSVAWHMGKQMEVNPAIDLLALVGEGEDLAAFQAKIEKEVQAPYSSILGKDLYLYPASEAYIWGNGKFLSSPRLDDLQCVYALLGGLIESNNIDAIPLLAIFHNEEVGSRTVQGGDSDFLEVTIRRICAALGIDPADTARMLSASFMVSADNAHAVHPNHAELSDDKDSGRCYMNHGIVIKNNASEKYATDGFSDAMFSALCQREKIPFQHYYNRADMPGGSTVGNISCSHVSVHTVDIGLPQLSMHSAMETAGTADAEYLKDVMKAYYATRLIGDDNSFSWK